MTKIGIIGAGTGALPPEVLKMAEEANVEIVELPRRNSGISRLQPFYDFPV